MAYNSSPLDTSPTSTQGIKQGGDAINTNFTEIPNMLALKEDKVKRTITTTDPTVNDDSSQGYSVWSLWANTTTSEVYRCIDVTVGAAKWEKTTLTIDELGGAALLDVGTTAGTVAAGDDSRFLTDVQKTDLTDGGESTLHYHASDRDRANHTGTQTLSTISDAGTAAAADIGTTAGTVAAGDHLHSGVYEPANTVSEHSSETGGIHGIPANERAIHSEELRAAISTATTTAEAVSMIGKGAIVESGSTPDGHYVRWENGEQVCFQTAKFTYNSAFRLTYTWSYPVNFLNNTPKYLSAQKSLRNEDDVVDNQTAPSRGDFGPDISGVRRSSSSTVFDFVRSSSASDFVSGDYYYGLVFAWGFWK